MTAPQILVALGLVAFVVACWRRSLAAGILAVSFIAFAVVLR